MPVMVATADGLSLPFFTVFPLFCLLSSPHFLRLAFPLRDSSSLPSWLLHPGVWVIEPEILQSVFVAVESPPPSVFSPFLWSLHCGLGY
ncbi:putative phosphatidylinositol 3,4,5-trisphosphate-dependent [Sesbania bispinosa]|nr:putative phosphatidylinositol 3,4,5-trisphosphate-dependent [Sesbania bispinosa]